MTNALASLEPTALARTSAATPRIADSPATPAARTLRQIPEELRASLAGSLRSPTINEAFIEQLMAKAAERAEHSRALRSRTTIDAYAAQAAISSMAASDGSGEAMSATVSQAPPASAALSAVREAYRSDGG
ncbi:hypothetical protein [Jiella avicenniae]|nr:hypothetical protein [Jiella avicenniae]